MTDKIQKVKETPMPKAYSMLADVVKSYDPETLNEEIVSSLRFMLKSESFAPIHSVIKEKIAEIKDYFRKKNHSVVHTNLEGKPIKPKNPRRDNRKKQKKAGNSGVEAVESTVVCDMKFAIDPQTGILVPMKK